MRGLTRRVIPLFCWAYAVWVLLTWTLTAEQAREEINGPVERVLAKYGWGR